MAKKRKRTSRRVGSETTPVVAAKDKTAATARTERQTMAGRKRLRRRLRRLERQLAGAARQERKRLRKLERALWRRQRIEAAIDEMSLTKQERMITVLRDPSNWINGKPDAILFSAGGNDIAGDQFCIFLDFNDGHSPGLNQDRFSKALGSIEACYLELFTLRDRIAPGVPIFGHCYDFPIPNGAHPACAGPWLKPSLDFCNWPVAAGRLIVHDALAAFRAMLVRLASNAGNKFHLVDTQGVLADAEWANELHPQPGGFAKIAQKFADALSANFVAQG